jgi:predicted amidohydrolase
MSHIRIALANLAFPATPQESIARVEAAIAEASAAHAAIVCFPECYVPGYRVGKPVACPDADFLDRAWATIAAAARQHGIAVVLGTERLVGDAIIPTVLIVQADGSIAGFQDKVQLDPSEDLLYTPGSERRVFTTAGLTFGVAICHEGWRYPETVRWAARRGAQVVFHPHLSEHETGDFEPTTFADARNSFHEKAMLCRAAENTCYFASVNYASSGSPTTSAIARPDGTLLCYQPYGREGLLVADLDLSLATGLLASRCRS